jgi:hypothetical protein
VASTSTNRVIATTSVVVATDSQVSSDLAGEAIILSLQTGMYYGLNPVGTRIWALLGIPTRVADIRDTIVQRYDVELDRCERDVLDLLRELAARGLIEVSDTT